MVPSQGWENPLEEAWQPTPAFLPGESHGQRRGAGYSPRGCKGPDMSEVTIKTTIKTPLATIKTLKPILFIILFIDLFLAMLGLYCCARAFSS